MSNFAKEPNRNYSVILISEKCGYLFLLERRDTENDSTWLLNLRSVLNFWYHEHLAHIDFPCEKKTLRNEHLTDGYTNTSTVL